MMLLNFIHVKLVCVLLCFAFADGSCSGSFVVHTNYVCQKAVPGQPVFETGGVFSCVHDGWGNDFSNSLIAIDIKDVIVKAIACDPGTCANSTCDLITDQRYKRGSCYPDMGHAVIMKGPTTTCGPLAVYSRELKCQLASTSRCSSSVVLNLADVHQQPQHACFASEACPYGLCTREGIANIGRCPRQDLNITLTVGNEEEVRKIYDAWPELLDVPTTSPASIPTTNVPSAGNFRTDSPTQPEIAPTRPPASPASRTSQPTKTPTDSPTSPASMPTDHPTVTISTNPPIAFPSIGPSAEPVIPPSSESSVAGTVWKWISGIVPAILLIAEAALVWHGWKYRRGYEDRVANADNLAVNPNDRPSYTKPATCKNPLIQVVFLDAFNGARYAYRRKTILHLEAVEDKKEDFELRRWTDQHV